MDITSDGVNLRILMFQDNGTWVAQCLEFDIGAQADDIDTLNDRLVVTLKAELKESIERTGKPFEGIEPAPERFQIMWERRVRSVDVTPASWVIADTKRKLNYALVA